MLWAVGAGAERAAGMAGPAGAVYSCFTYSRTSAAWPATVTLRQILRMIPALSITKVMRSMPRNVLPYRDFSFIAP